MKLLSFDPLNYSDAQTEGIMRIVSQFTGYGNILRDAKIPIEKINSIRMGTTVATNALLERKGERVALFVNQRFRNTLQIGNQSGQKIF